MLDYSEKFQLCPHILHNFGGHGKQLNSAAWTAFMCLLEDYSRNISVEGLSKCFSKIQKNGQLLLFPLYVYGN